MSLTWFRYCFSFFGFSVPVPPLALCLYEERLLAEGLMEGSGWWHMGMSRE